jgi:hypothetical protein
MPPLALSDDQLTAIMQAAAPLPFHRRAAFLEEIAAQLRGREIGDGLVHRVIAQVQCAHFDPPDLSRMSGSSKYSLELSTFILQHAVVGSAGR